MKKLIKLSDIITDAGTQVRASINEETVAEYAEAYKAGDEFPPLQVFADGNKYLLADGFHRYMGATRMGMKEHWCLIRPGTRTDCIRFALSCNVHHGLRRTNLDKRHAVEIAIVEFPKASLSILATMCFVSEELVALVKKQLTDFGGLKPSETVIGKDGKERKLPSRPPPVVTPRTAPAHQSPPPTPKPVRKDRTGHTIPDALLPLWDRAEEWQGVLSEVSTVRGVLRKAQEDRDLTAVEINMSSAMSHLDQAYADIKTALPFAVCPTCAGKMPDKCTLCKGKGFLSEHRWNTCVAREIKEVRSKTRKV